MTEKPLYPGFTELDLNPSSVEDFDELPAHVQRIAEQITDDAIYMHEDRHTRLRHPMCLECELEKRPGLRYYNFSSPELKPYGPVVAQLTRDFNKGVPAEEAIAKAVATGIPEDVAAKLHAAVESNWKWNQAHDFDLDTVRMRAARYFTIHGRAPLDLYDDETAKSDDDLYLTRGQLAELPSPEWLVDRTLPEYSYIVLAGRDATYKSFIAVSWACSMATGKPWLGRKTQSRRVLYIAGEGAHGLHSRIAAWEYAWNGGQAVPDEQLVIRKEAINLFRGGPALERLLERIQADDYGLVIIDTLNKSSGPANANGFDANHILASIEKIKRATSAGSVLVISHTDKSDIDTRGFSGFEDDGDVVWHAKRDGHAVSLVNRKMKEAPDGERLELTARPVLESLILQGGDTSLDLEEANASQAAILELLAQTFTHTGATKAELRDVCGLPRSTFYRSLNSLIDAGKVTTSGKGASAIYRAAIPTGRETENPTAIDEMGIESLTDSHDSHRVPTDSHASATDSHPSHTSIEVGRWESPELAEKEDQPA
jgi:hypothetical protein